MIQNSPPDTKPTVGYLVLGVNLDYNDEYYYSTDGYNPLVPVYESLDEAKARGKVLLRNMLHGIEISEWDEGEYIDEYSGDLLTDFIDQSDHDYPTFDEFINWCIGQGRDWVPEVPQIVTILETPIRPEKSPSPLPSAKYVSIT